MLTGIPVELDASQVSIQKMEPCVAVYNLEAVYVFM